MVLLFLFHFRRGTCFTELWTLDGPTTFRFERAEWSVWWWCCANWNKRTHLPYTEQWTLLTVLHLDENFTGNAFKLLVIKQRDIAISVAWANYSSFNSVNIKYKIVEVQNHIPTNVLRHINANAKAKWWMRMRMLRLSQFEWHAFWSHRQ